MKKTTTFFKTLLVAVALLVGAGNAWAGETVGAEDLSTGYLAAHSTVKTIANGGSLHYVFTQTKATDANYKGWLLWVGARNAEVNWANGISIVRGDNWDDKWPTTDGDGNSAYGSNAGCTSNFNWDTFNADMNGATVDMTVNYTSGTLIMSTTISNGDKSYFYNYAKPVDGAPASVDACLSVNEAYLNITTDEYTIADITAIPVVYDYTTQDALDGNVIAPFDAGTVKAGTNVKALTISNQTATAWFDSDTETEGRQPYAIASNEKVNIFINAYHGWLGGGKTTTVTVYAPEGKSLASYVYDVNACKLSDVKIGGVTPAGFEAVNFQNKNGLTANGRNPFIASDNPEISISISGSKYVEMIFTKGGTAVASYSATLDDSYTMALEKLEVKDASNNADRAYHIGKLSISTEITADATVTYNFEDTEGNTIADSQTAPGKIGDAIAEVIPAGLKNTFYNEDGSVKYVFDSYSCADETVPADGTTVTLKFNAYRKFTHNVMAVDADNNELGEIATGSTFSDETLTLFWNKYVKINDHWLVTNSPYGGSYTEGGTTNVTFATADIVDFIECENTNYSSSGDNTGNNNASDGKAVLLSANKSMALKTMLAAGKYDISIYAYVRRANDDGLKLQYSTDNQNWVDVEEKIFTNSRAMTNTWENVVLEEDSYIRFQDTKNQNSCHYYDYIVIAPHYNTYTVKIKNTEIVLGSGSCKDGEDYSVVLSQVIASDGKYYVLSDESVEGYKVTYTMEQDGEERVVEYTEDPTIVYYTEGVPSGYMNEVKADGYSAGNYVTVNTNANHGNARNRGYGVGTLSAGEYEITASIVGSNGRNICVRTNDGSYNTGNTPLVSLRNRGVQKGNFALGGDQSIVITGANSKSNSEAADAIYYGSKSGHMEDFDYIIIRKLSDEAAEYVKVSDAGYATYYSEYAIDFTNTGLTAYIAKEEGNEVSFEEVKTVPAKTGVLLKGEANTYTVPVIASSATDVADNAFVGSLVYTKIDGAGIFVLMNKEQGVGFYKTTADAFTVGAHTAYLPADAAARAFIGFGDEATGISAVNRAEEDGEAIFNLQGLRVGKAVKGLYIKNGKKVIVK